MRQEFARYVFVFAACFVLAVGAMAQDLTGHATPPELESVKGTLTTRLVPEEGFVELLEQTVWRRDFADVLTVLAYDFPTHVQYVPRAHADAWGVSDDDLLNLGTRNVLDQFSVVTDGIPEYGVHFLLDDEGYAPTFLYGLASFPEVIGRYGSLVSIPDQYTMIILPLEGPESTRYSSGLVNGTINLFMDAEDPVSYHIWWYRQGEFSQVDIVVEGSIYLLLPKDIFSD